jgi:hypothetical protein
MFLLLDWEWPQQLPQAQRPPAVDHPLDDVRGEERTDLHRRR